MATEDSKTCGRCRGEFPLSAFYRGGKAGYCIACEKAYKREHYSANAERIKAKTRAWSAANPQRKRATDRAYVEANRERVSERRAEYQRGHHAEQLARSLKSRRSNLSAYRAREAAYRAQNRAACKERISEWKRKNPHATVAYAGKRRAAELQAIPAWADLDAIAAIYRKAQELGAGYHVDHTVPLISKFVCGLHCEANLRIIPAGENMKKNNRHWPDMWEPL